MQGLHAVETLHITTVSPLQPQIPNCGLKTQLTLEQRGFELHGSYTGGPVQFKLVLFKG